MSKPDPTTWSYKHGVRSAVDGLSLDDNPCDPVAEAGRFEQWVFGFNADAISRADAGIQPTGAQS